MNKNKIFQTKFSLGQRVWAVSTDQVYRLVKCNICNCSGEIKIKGETLSCPKCQGKTRHQSYVGDRDFISTEGVVGKITIEVYLPVYHDTSGHHKDRAYYMLDSTGIGSGTLWDEEKLFATKEEAQGFCWNYNEDRVFTDEQL